MNDIHLKWRRIKENKINQKLFSLRYFSFVKMPTPLFLPDTSKIVEYIKITNIPVVDLTCICYNIYYLLFFIKHFSSTWFYVKCINRRKCCAFGCWTYNYCQSENLLVFCFSFATFSVSFFLILTYWYWGFRSNFASIYFYKLAEDVAKFAKISSFKN